MKWNLEIYIYEEKYVLYKKIICNLIKIDMIKEKIDIKYFKHSKFIYELLFEPNTKR